MSQMSPPEAVIWKEPPAALVEPAWPTAPTSAEVQPDEEEEEPPDPDPEALPWPTPPQPEDPVSGKTARTTAMARPRKSRMAASSRCAHPSPRRNLPTHPILAVALM